MDPTKALKRAEFITPAFQTDEQFSVDRNFTRYSYKFYTNFGSDSSLVIAIICYVQQNISKLEQDIFGMYEFDYKKFAIFYACSPQYLIGKHKNPLFKTVSNGDVKSFFYSRLGNALYSLKKKPFNDHYMQHNVGKDKRERVEEDLLFFQNLDVMTIKGKTGKDKYVIRFSLNDKLEVGIFKFFDRIDKKIITNREIRKDNIDTLYLYLASAKNTSCFYGENRFDVVSDWNSGLSPFDFLSVIMQVDNIKRFDHRKEKMFEKMKHLNKITGDPVNLCFDVSSTGKSHNQPYFTWVNFEPYKKEQLAQLYNSAFEEYFTLNLKKSWKLFHLEATNVKTKYSFQEWRAIETYDYKIKMEAFIKTWAELKGQKLDITSEQVIMRFGTPEQKTLFQKKKAYGPNYGK